MVRIGWFSAALLLVLAVAGEAVYLCTTIPGERPTPSGHRRAEALYLTMRDGVRIAVDVVFPSDFGSGERAPTAMLATRYWRSARIGPVRRILIGLGLDDGLQPDVSFFNQHRYVVVRVDARGTGASFGHREIEWPPDEILDYGEIIDWIAKQPWSNGRVGTYGASYDGNTAELAAVMRRPALKVVAPLYADFDPAYAIATSRGIMSDWFIHTWSDYIAALDRNSLPCIGIPTGGCWLARLILPGVKPVDADPNGELLQRAVADHRNVDVYAAVAAAQFRDDRWGSSGLTLSDVSPFHFRKELETSGVAYYTVASWVDSGTVDGALSRYRTFANNQHLIVAFRSHGGAEDGNPFKPANAPVTPSVPEQWTQLVTFFDRYLKEEATPAPHRAVEYETAGLGWRTSESWPPPDLRSIRYYFAVSGQLVVDAPAVAEARDVYPVDFSVGSGRETTRWHTSMGRDVYYGDRRVVDQKLLTYTTVPFAQDMEVTGNGVVELYLTSSTRDDALIAYLEDVAPDGRVTYLSEGDFRAVHRAISTSQPEWVEDGPFHSFRRGDASELPSDRPVLVSFTMYATSVVVKAGHRIRVALAGHDADLFRRYPEVGNAIWNVFRDQLRPSHVDLPMRAVAQ